MTWARIRNRDANDEEFKFQKAFCCLFYFRFFFFFFFFFFFLQHIELGSLSLFPTAFQKLSIILIEFFCCCCFLLNILLEIQINRANRSMWELFRL
jgi:hypothetical protein